MKNLLTITLLCLIAVNLNAGGSKPPTQDPKKDHYAQILNLNHKIANMSSEIDSLAAERNGLLVENNQLIGRNTKLWLGMVRLRQKKQEIIHSETVKTEEVQPWWMWPLILSLAIYPR